jgi:hypothetical protein
MAESQEYYEVIINFSYGGFKFPYEFLEAVFRAYPPDSEIGSKLWDACDYDRIIREGELPNPSWDSFQIIASEKPFYNGYKRVTTKRASKDISGNIQILNDANLGRHYSYYTKDYVNYYFLSQYETEWRDSPHVIELGKKFGLFYKTKRLGIEREDDSEHDSEEEENSEEDEEEDYVFLDDSNEMEIVTKACKGKTSLILEKIPVGYDYHVREYDGSESIAVVFPYKKVIQELLEARKTNSDDKLGPITKKLVDGTLDASKI